MGQRVGSASSIAARSTGSLPTWRIADAAAAGGNGALGTPRPLCVRLRVSCASPARRRMRWLGLAAHPAFKPIAGPISSPGRTVGRRRLPNGRSSVGAKATRMISAMALDLWPGRGAPPGFSRTASWVNTQTESLPAFHRDSESNRIIQYESDPPHRRSVLSRSIGRLA